jgi:hypothetical protein
MWLIIPTGQISTISITHGPRSGYFTRETAAFEAKPDAFVIGACGYLAELVVLGYTALYAIGTTAFNHAGTFLAGYSANTDFHVMNFPPVGEL